MATEANYLRSLGFTPRATERVFSHGGLAAGVYTATWVLPAGSHLDDILVEGVALWNNGTSATLNVGDAGAAGGYFSSVNLKATDLLAGESISFAFAGGKAGSYIANSQISPRYSAAERTITAVITTVGTVPTTGETRIVTIYSTPSPASRADATYVAS